MAVKTSVTTTRSYGGKTQIYWTKDTAEDKDSQIVKVHVPGVNLEPLLDIKKPMVKRPVKNRKPINTVSLQKSSQAEPLHQSSQKLSTGKIIEPIDDVPVKDTSSPLGADTSTSSKNVSLKDLRPEDKKRVANLVNELAKVGEERELALSQLTQERVAFEERLQILQEEYDSNTNEKLMQNRFLELQELLKRYKVDEKSRTLSLTESRKTHSSHTTQTSPLVKLHCDQQTSFEEIPGNVRHGSRRSPQHAQTGLDEAKISRQSTPLPGNGDQMQKMSSESNQIQPNLEGITHLAGSATNPLQSHHGPASNTTSTEFSRRLDVIPQHSQASGPFPVEPTATQQSHLPGFYFLPNVQATQERAPISQLNINQSSSHPPPPKSAEQDPPVYANRIFDISVSRPEAARLQQNDNNSRPQSDTSQSFSAELNAVYRLYCHEYELQLQLQQQQLELQKQQLQLQQQLQQLELFQQRQHTQQPVTGPVKQHQPSTPAKTIIRETPDPTPAPQPSAQPEHVNLSDRLVPTPDDACTSQPGQSSMIDDKFTGKIDEREKEERPQTIRRITSSKRPQQSQNDKASSNHEGSYTSHHHTVIDDTAGYNENFNDYTQTTQHQASHVRRPSLNKEIIRPEEAAQFKFSLYKNRTNLPHSRSSHFTGNSSKPIESSIDWSATTDFEFRRMQENRIREHYGLRQYPLQSTQASIGSTGTRHSYDMYDTARVAQEPSQREVDERLYYGHSHSDRHPHGVDTDMPTQGVPHSHSDRHSYRVDTDMPTQGVLHSHSDRHPYRVDTDMPTQGIPHSHYQRFRGVFEDHTSSDHHYSLYTRDQPGYYDNGHHGDTENAVPSDVIQRGYQSDQSPEYPLQIVDLVHEMEDKPTISRSSKKPSFTVYSRSPSDDIAALSNVLDSTDSGYSQVSRDISEHKNPLLVSVQGSGHETDNEELDVLEDIFFIK